MSKFQITVIGIFIVAIIAGVAVFATYKGAGSSSTQLPPITVWGTFPADTFNNYVAKINQTLSAPLGITYVQKSQSAFSDDFVRALAVGQGPDAILVPADMLLPQMNKITPIPYTALSQRTFMDSYINEAQIYLSNNGALAVPFVIDPLVMYWNKDMFAAAGLASYPKYWDEFTALNKTLTQKDQNGNIRRSAIAMGDFNTVLNARELLGTLFLQSGNTVTSISSTGAVTSALSNSGPTNLSSALQYFTQFVNPNSSNYSWNGGMTDSKTAFLSGTLATYFGFASELGDIRAKNPNLNFDVAPIPQWRSGGQKATYGRMYGFSLVRASSNQNAAYQTIAILTNQANLSMLSQMTYLPPVSSSLIAQGSSDPYMTIFDQAALISRTWFDADQAQSYQIFGNMVNAVVSGAKNASDAINDASDQYNVVLGQATQ
ncbi:extracellular solute-binding protein [Patescibacteria group bacterium]|nr:extracellular solute-binding protein [Patescibacteria group bacterium]MDE1946319.1 extracellular solute-binding protein [Patescibacteria group bacterium]MDE2010771.1 extracellular solute-binding protein [Patescibacteria group bacterium]MDE2232656.1 extracellular solute-binding protein [Patescibacteria group bacterium]